jgi:hypothetical protein
MNNFKILITSPPHRERLVAEIWYNNMYWVEITQEQDQGEVRVYFYPHPQKLCWEFSFDEAIAILEKAKNRLVSM